MAGRVRHPIDTKALERYISENVPEIQIPLDVKQFGFGQSNPTYQLTAADGQRYVLRKKPPGKLLSKAAHKVEREYRIIAALSRHGTGVPVPRALCLCEDPSVVGTPFYIMSFVGGRIIEDPAMPGVSSPDERAALWHAAVSTLARLHAVDPEAVGLGSFGGGGGGGGGGVGEHQKKGGFYARQLRTWRGICDAQAATRDADTGAPVGPLPHFEPLLEFFGDAARRPRDRAALIHGDYKIDNLVFHATEPRVVGILDWEMSTVGHPLSDLANLMQPFYSAEMLTWGEEAAGGHGGGNASSSTSIITHPGFLPGATPGLPDADTVLRWYAEAAGTWDPRPEMGWAVAFSTFRLSAICQGIAARVAARQASSESARRHAEAMFPLAELAWVLVRREKDKARDEDKRKLVPLDEGGGGGGEKGVPVPVPTAVAKL
ncbi:aminoglycoside phosphotransferase-like protein [Biscogniauxia sp. FL1348]|nr:aminoglycoside phosphotransferase-like protein [Biscogniauxia sp. FL1348]